MFSKNYYVYILASKKNGTLYTGVTGQLENRILQHNVHLNDGFTKKYSVNILVYYEVFSNIENAIKREKQIKKWKREWKISLIEKDNYEWNDLRNKEYVD